MMHLVWLLVIAVGLLVLATLLRSTNDARRPRVRLRLRRTVILFVPYLLLALLATYGPQLGTGLWLSVITIAADFMAILLTINLAAAFIFDFLLQMVRLRAPDILHDLVVGTTYVVALVWLMHRSGLSFVDGLSPVEGTGESTF